mmetsp:Transcript_21945/g.24379  ORF Transcript_21945/g.24379 Transcript_21945/m.24379 type:complete len:139 (+) Transcript_21945:415-831(+)|eukprot:CAMPEP_0205826516 /NCGR_PEP_ID=MMETSP0206-20130828/28912_1 /ASSEMBLY_ACC=CAM_ASM_000279 /TAXON_ID=36767 /ORGANISM="Euplotes focardii, Strain TN1" /LENGTH=138 /DNA_ID=CAMNT_0053126507 /DNA_START=415 /DNA_END=831 /DNA_ORIENTATION=-
MKREAKMMEFSDNWDLASLQSGCHSKLKITETLMELWKTLSLDCFVLPATSVPPLKHGQSSDLMIAFLYTAMINGLDYPAGIIPNVIKIEGEHLEEMYIDPVWGNDSISKAARECLKGSEGLGMAVQICTMTGEEESV